MNLIQDCINFNQYVHQPKSTQTTANLEAAFRDLGIESDDIDVYFVLIQYPRWTKDTDFFRWVKPKVRKALRKNPKSFFIFDASTEGFSPIYSDPFFDILYKMSNDYKIPPKRIFFCSSNMKDNDNIKNFNRQHNIKDTINVFTFLNFERMILGVKGQQEVQMDPLGYEIGTNSMLDSIVLKRLNTAVDQTKKLAMQSKAGLSLSRINRAARLYSSMKIYNSKYRDDFLISHNAVRDEDIDWLMMQIPFVNDPTAKKKYVQQFQKKLPLIVDTDDFKTNHATSLHGDLNDKTLFQIVNETHVDDWKQTSLFYSEKTFRSIYHMQPFVIWGQTGCNKRLADYGYMTYDSWFDLGFDSIEDPTKRWAELWKSVTSQLDKIRTMTLEEKWYWKFKNETVLKHNFRTLLEGKYSKDVFCNTALKMRNIANEQ